MRCLVRKPKSQETLNAEDAEVAEERQKIFPEIGRTIQVALKEATVNATRKRGTPVYALAFPSASSASFALRA
jgi:hypothetical protein